MSTSSRTPDDKMHRYLQRIQKLVGHRGKSPVMIKSRNKSPLSVKTPRLDNMVKYELFLKTIHKTFQNNQKRYKQEFIDQCKLQNHTYQHKYLLSTPAPQKRSYAQKPNQKIISSQTIQELIDNLMFNRLSQSFQFIKQYVPQQPRNKLLMNKNHRRTYSQMYADTINNTRSKSPSTICNYEYRTPEVVKKETISELKQKQTRILVHSLEKVLHKKIFNSFSELKSYSCKFLMFEYQSMQQNYELSQQKMDAVNKQLSSLNRKNNQYQKQNKELKEKLRQVTQQNFQLQNEIQLINSGQYDANQQNKQLLKTLQDTRKQFEINKRQLILLKNQNGKNSKDLICLKKDLQVKNQQLQLAKRQIIEKQQELQSIESLYQQLRKNFDVKNEKQKIPIDSKYKQFEDQAKQLQLQLKNQEKLRKQTQKKLLSVQNELQNARNSINQLHKQVEENKEVLRTQQTNLQIIQAQSELNKKQCEQEKTQKLALQKQLQEQKKSLQSVRKLLKDKEDEIIKINKQLEIKGNQLSQTENQLYLRQEKLGQKQKQLQNHIKLLDSSKKQLDLLKKKSLQKDSLNKYNQSAIQIQIDSKDQQISQLKKQLIISRQQHQKLTNELLQSQKNLNEQKEKIRILSEKQLEKQNQQQIHDQEKQSQHLILERKLAALNIHQLLSAKFASRKSKFFQTYSELPNIRASYQSKCLFMEKVINDLLKDRKKFFIKNLCFIPLKSSGQKESQICEKSLTSQIKMKSLYSSKQSLKSLSNASILSSNFDIFAKKINKAFELKIAFHEIYSYAFQKIDYAALLYMGISNPINKQIQKNLLDSFRKILYFSISKTQQDKSHSLGSSQILKKGEQILSFLRKIDNKIVFTKIEAYSHLKLHSDLLKSQQIPNQSVISEKELKRELKDFLQQRNKIYEKTYQTWEKTKQMIEDYKLASSQRAY